MALLLATVLERERERDLEDEQKKERASSKQPLALDCDPLLSTAHDSFDSYIKAPKIVTTHKNHLYFSSSLSFFIYIYIYISISIHFLQLFIFIFILAMYSKSA